MRRIILGLALLTLSATVFPHPASACGDKLVDISQGILPQRAQRAIQSGSILVYLTKTPVDQGTRRLVKLLTRVGNDVRIVTTLDELTNSLQSKDYDLVLADLDDLPAVRLAVELQTDALQLIPVLREDKNKHPVETSSEYRYTVSIPGRAHDQISTVNDALKARAADVEH